MLLVFSEEHRLNRIGGIYPTDAADLGVIGAGTGLLQITQPIKAPITGARQLGHPQTKLVVLGSLVSGYGA